MKNVKYLVVNMEKTIFGHIFVQKETNNIFEPKSSTPRCRILKFLKLSIKPL